MCKYIIICPSCLEIFFFKNNFSLCNHVRNLLFKRSFKRVNPAILWQIASKLNQFNMSFLFCKNSMTESSWVCNFSICSCSQCLVICHFACNVKKIGFTGIVGERSTLNILKGCRAPPKVPGLHFGKQFCRERHCILRTSSLL